MSCCGNNFSSSNKYNIPNKEIINNVNNNTNNTTTIIKSPFSNYTTNYNPVLTPNGKFVKYIREIKK